MVEQTYGLLTVDRIIQAANLSSEGAYTSVGTYEHTELLAFVKELNAVTLTPPAELVRLFGRHLFSRFVDLYPQFFEGIDSAFDFLKNVEDYIHVEVLKLYPDAELPSFRYVMPEAGRMELTYLSPRPLADLADGLIQGCVEHFQEAITVEREAPVFDQGHQRVRFILTCLQRMPRLAT